MARRVHEPEVMAHVGGGWWLVHGLPLLAPGIGCLIWGVLVHLAHLAWGGDPFVTPVLALLFFILGTAVTYYGWMSSGNRRALRIAVAVSGAVATGALVFGLIFGLLQGWLISLYMICSIVVWILWGIWRSSKYAGANSHDGEATPLLEAVKNAQISFSQPTVDERGVVRAKVHTKPGGTLDDARALVPMLSSAARAVPGGAHLSAHPDRDGVATLEIPTRDNLKERLAWPGVADLLGSLPTEAFPVAEYQSGPCRVRLVGDFDKDRGAEDIKHVKIGGVTRSGKSTGALVILASLLVKRRLNVIGVDLTKEMQTFGPVAHGLTWVITDVDEARLFMARLPKVIEGRTAQLAKEGLRRWSLRSSLNLTVIWLEESKEFRRFQAQYEKVVADAGSAGIIFVSSTQDWIYRQVSTSVRKNHGAGICFGVEEAEDASYVLPDRAIAALGKNGMPTWGSTRPGYCYIAGLGIPESKWARMARFYDPLDEQLIEAVELGAPYRDPVDDITAALFGELFTRRTVYRTAQWGQPAETPAPPRVIDAAVPSHRARPQHATTADEDEAPLEQEEAEAMAEEENEQDRQEMFGRLDDARRRELGADATPADFADVDPDEEIDADVEDTGEEDDEEDSTPLLSPAEAQRVWDELLDELYRSGARRVETSQLTEWLGDVKRERPFLYRQTDRWEARGFIARRPNADGWDLIGSPLERAHV